MKKYGIILGILFSIPVWAYDIQEVQIGRMATYTWSDFLEGKSCTEDFNQLNTLDFISPKQQFLKDKMQTYCMGNITVWDTLLSSFRQNKKALLMDRILKENGLVMGYIKTIPYQLVDIHNTHPIGADLSSKLDRIQNAIQSKNPEQVVLLMQDLSPNEQLFFMPLFNESNTLIDFKNALQGGQND